MKRGIHPKYNDKVTITCSCGNTFEVGSTVANSIQVEVCSKCHPFWTGAQKFVDIEHRVDKFKKKQEIAEKTHKQKVKKIKKRIERERLRAKAPKTLKDMLKSMQ